MACGRVAVAVIFILHSSLPSTAAWLGGYHGSSGFQQSLDHGGDFYRSNNQHSSYSWPQPNYYDPHYDQLMSGYHDGPGDQFGGFYGTDGGDFDHRSILQNFGISDSDIGHFLNQVHSQFDDSAPAEDFPDDDTGDEGDVPSHDGGRDTPPSPCVLQPEHEQDGPTPPDWRPDFTKYPIDEAEDDDSDFDMNESDLDNLLEMAREMYDIDLGSLLLDEPDENTDQREVKQQLKGDAMPILERRKRSPEPRRSSSSRSSSSRSSSSRRSSPSSSSSSGSSSRSRWSWGWGSRSPSSSSGSSSSRSSPSRSSSSSSSSRGTTSSSGSTSRNVAIGTGVVAGAGIGGAAIASGTSSSSSNYKPSAPPLESTPGRGSTSGSPYPTSGSTNPSSGSTYPTANAPYPTSGGRPTAGAPYPTPNVPYPNTGSAGGSYPTAAAPYPTAAGRPTAGAPYPTAGAPYPTAAGRPTAGAPYPTAGAPYPTAGAPYPTAGAPYPTASSPYPTASAPYPTARAPYPASRPGYPTAGAPYPTGGSYPGASYPSGGSRYPGTNTGYPGSFYAAGGAAIGSSSFGNRGSSGMTGFPSSQGSFVPRPKKSKSKKVKEAIKMAIAGYAVHKTQKKIRKGLFSPFSISHRRRSYGHSFGGGFGHSYGGGYGYGGGGYGYGGGYGHHSSLGSTALRTGGKVAKKILGAYVKIQIAKYALKFGVEAAKIYFRHKLGYDLRDEAIEKFIRRYQRRTLRRQQGLLGVGGVNSTVQYNITAGEDCARVCRDNDTRVCLFTFKVHLYQTLTRACYDCPRNLTDCLRPECITGAGSRRLLTVVNRQLPGPAIQVCMGDRVLVEVSNDLPSSGVTFHWHGLTMDEDPYMDGVAGLTQCSIQPRQGFTYSFKASFPGTHYWRAQEGLLRGEGLYGPLIVRKPEIYEPNKIFYDHDLTAHVITISELPSMTSEAQFAERFFNEDVAPKANLLINGRAGRKEGSTATLPYARIDVAEGKRYRLRLINAAALNCPVRVVAPEGHNFTVIAADGANIAAFYTHSLVIYNGERWDVVLVADQPPALYWITVLGEVECQNASQSLVLSYKESVPDPLLAAANLTDLLRSNGSASTMLEDMARLENATRTKEEILDFSEDTELPTVEPITEDKSILMANTFSENCSSPNVTCLSEMRSLLYAPLPDFMAEPWLEDTLFLSFSAQPLYNSHFYSLLFYGPEFMPPAKRSTTPQVNNLSLRLPAKALLLDKSPLKRDACSADGVRRKQCVGDYCECLHNNRIEQGKVVELVLINEGFRNETVPQPVHLHGFRFWVIGQDVYEPMNATTGADSNTAANSTTAADSNSTASNSTTAPSTNSTVTEEEEDDETDDPSLPQPQDSDGFTRLHAINLYSKNKLKRNFFHPIMKDTIMIPAGGYTVVRFMAHNKGFWLGQSQVLLQAAAGQGFVLQVGNSTQLPRPPKGFPRCSG